MNHCDCCGCSVSVDDLIDDLCFDCEDDRREAEINSAYADDPAFYEE